MEPEIEFTEEHEVSADLKLEITVHSAVPSLVLADFFVRIVELAEEMGLEVGGGYEQKQAA